MERAQNANGTQGPILAFIYAVKELLETSSSGGLGCNVAFVFEGEEENGSGGFRNALRSNLKWCELPLRIPMVWRQRRLQSSDLQLCEVARKAVGSRNGGVGVCRATTCNRARYSRVHRGWGTAGLLPPRDAQQAAVLRALS